MHDVLLQTCLTNSSRTFTRSGKGNTSFRRKETAGLARNTATEWCSKSPTELFRPRAHNQINYIGFRIFSTQYVRCLRFTQREHGLSDRPFLDNNERAFPSYSVSPPAANDDGLRSVSGESRKLNTNLPSPAVRETARQNLGISTTVS